MAKQTFQVDIQFLANINDLQTKIKNVTGEIAKMSSSSGSNQVQKQFDRLTQSVQNLQTKAQQPITSQAEFNKLTSELNKAQGAYDNLLSSVERMKSMSAAQKLELLPADQQANIQKAAQALKNFEASAKTASSAEKDLDAATAKLASRRKDLEGIKTAQSQIANVVQQHENKLKSLQKAQKEVTQAEKQLKEAQNSGAGDEKIQQLAAQLETAKSAAIELGVNFTKNKSSVESFSQATAKVQKDMNNLKTSANSIKLAREFTEANTEITELDAAVKRLQGQNPTAQLQTAFNELKAKAESCGVSLDGLGDGPTEANIEQLKSRLEQLRSQGLERVDAEIDEVSASLRGDLRSGLDTARQGLDQASNSFNKFNQQAQEVDQLKSQLGYFFSLTNSVYLLRSALQSAFETVKELDAVMTETAVVTDFSVADMWEKLPEYSAAASELGSSIKDVYAATTLYYQQGLKTEAAMTVGIETMKMARIANMEAEEATQAMTAALRGFNMAVDETNALRINDVYSNLAAITAADTEQIATAMTKTASIASSANMEFETTAALLAQIIETTQEAPETAGTALKTIIARFSEVKELQNKGLSSGEDEEGESIDVNKIDKALKTVGISMDGFFAGTEGLDSVLMRLAEKWDTLDFTTQRYIATMAAGSRQQSRFIAMMSDYERTTQLVSAANNSAGASQKQFGKTMEGIEAKLNRLKVAWDTFTMNIADDELIKLGIDLLTGLLNIINKLTGSLPGLLGSFANLALVFGALRVGGALLGKALTGLSGILAKGVINEAAEAGIVTQAAETGAKAGTALTTSTAASINGPGAQAALAASYTKLLLKTQATVPPITVTMRTDVDHTALSVMEGRLAQIRTQKAGLNKDTATYNALAKEEAALQAQIASGYTLSGGAVDKLGDEQKELLYSAYLNKQITAEQIALLGPEALARYTNAVATGSEEKAIEQLNFELATENNLRKGGLSAFFTRIGLQVMGIAGNQGEKKSIKQLTAEKWKEFAARMAANSAMITGIALVIAIVAGIALLIVGISKLVKTYQGMKDGSLEMEKLNKKLEEVTEQTNEAAEAMNNLADSKSGLEDLTSQLDDLTKGTTEWKQKLTEVNMQVLELLDKYPELAGYVIRGEHGEMQINEEGWQQAQDAAYERYNLMAQTSIGLQTQKTAATQEINFEAAQSEAMQAKISYEEMRNSEEGKQAFGYAMGGVGLAGVSILGAKAGAALGTSLAPGVGSAIGAVLGGLLGLGAGYFLGSEGISRIGQSEESIQREATGGLTEKEYTAFAAAAAEKGITHNDTEGLKQLYAEMGFASENMNAVVYKIRELGDSFDQLANTSLQLETAQEAYVDTFVSQATARAGLENNKYIEQAQEVSSEIYEKLDEQIANKVKEMPKNLDEDALREYAQLSGKSLDQVKKELKDETISEDTIKEALATNEVQKETQKALKKTIDALSKLENQGKDLTTLFNILSKSGKNITKEDLNNFGDLEQFDTVEKQKKAVEDFLASQGTSLTALGLDGENDWQVIWENLNTAANAYKDADKKTEQWNGRYDSRVTSGAVDGVVKQIEEQTAAGARGAGDIMNTIADITTDMDTENATLFYEALNSINWDSIASIEQLDDKLEDLGFDMGELGERVNGLQHDIMDFADATYNLTPEEKAKVVDDVRELEKKINTGARKFTAEEYDMFTDETKKEFIQDGTEWIYYGDLSSTELVEDVYTKAGRGLSTELPVEAYNIRENAKQEQGYTTVYDTAQSSGKYGYYNFDEGKISTNGLFHSFGVGQHRNGGDFDGAEVFEVNEAGLIVADSKITSPQNYNPYDYYAQYLYDNDEGIKKQVDSGNLSMSELSGKVATDYLAGNIDEDLFSEKTLMQMVANPQVAKILSLQYYAQTYGIDGVDKEATLGEIEQWYLGLDKGGQQYFSEIAGAVFSSKYLEGGYGFAEKGGDPYLEGWGQSEKMQNVLAGEVSGNNVTKESDWEFLKRLDPSGLKNYDGTIGNEEIGDQFLDPNRINELYKKYIGPDGTAETVQQKREALYNYYTDINEKTEGVTQADFAQSMALASPQELLDLTSSNMTQEAEIATKVLSGQFSVIDGGTAMLEAWQKQLKEGGSALAGNTNLIKAQVVAYDKHIKKIDVLNSTLKDQYDAFKKGPKAGQKYYSALQNIAEAAKQVFGDEVDTNYIEQHKQWFLDLQKGGTKAQAAYEAINKDLAIAYMKTKGLGDVTDETSKIMNDALSSVKPGEAIDLTSYYNKLMQIEGMTEEAAKNIIDKWGFEVTYETKTVWIDEHGTQYEKDPGPNIKTTKTEMIVGVSGTKESSDGTGGGGGGGGGGGSKWKNSFDKFYNVYEEINKLLREREKLERHYDKLLEKRGVTAKELIESSKEELANLEEQRKNQEILVEGKKKQAEDFTQSKKGKKYAKYYTYDSETGEINIDWDAVNKLKGSKGEGFEEFISELEGLRDQFQEAEDALFDIEDAVQDILEQGKEEYVNLETRIKDALVDQRQREIDKLSEINDSINDTNSKLLDSMQKQIDEYRQNRDNQKTEEEIADKQRRLAYLQQDTSGANATEILKLQKEIDEAQEDYTDTLIDQKISELQDQNDQAAEQRQRQIDLMEQQLQHWQDSGEIWKKVYELINEQSLDGGVSAEVLDLLKTADGFSGLSDVQKMDWLKELEGDVAQALDWLNTGAFKTLYQEDDTVQFTTKDGKVLSGTVDKQGNVVVEDEEGNQSLYSGSNISMDANGKLISSQTEEEARKAWLDSQKPEWPENLPKPSTVTGTIKKGSSKAAVKGVQTALTQLGYDEVGKIDGDYGSKTTTAVKHFQKDEGATNPSGNVGTWTKEKFKLHEYKTGGLADFTGPAWLDGTRSRPEYILNADQTKAFFNLIDVLGSLRDGDSKTAQNNGDNNYDIDINIESIGSDYDVEQLATKVKSLINEDARYRNNNAVNLMR